ncbi:MAG: FAD-dependent monooxygenase [Deltaproteobacteria bacterium]|nr:FAD-dependent monooxygenase [Deltaproteobacteria bacterium]MCB9787031.1 FAD-dependent monooxygenase [Deltaproteobacteria bacterium]
MAWLIAGGGIGGLAAAIALRRAGREVQIFERADDVRASGQGITVSVNAMVALGELGLADAVLAAGVRLSGAELRRADGRALMPLHMDAMEAAHGMPSVGILRGALLGVMLEAIGAERVRTSARCVGYRMDGEGVAMRLAGGEEVRGEALIGADGAGSAVRAQLLGEAAPRYAGYTCWRGLADVAGEELGEGGFFEMWGRGARFGGIPVSADRFFWYAAANAPRRGRDEAGEVIPRLRARFAGFAEPVATLLARTAPEGVLRTDIEDRPPTARWGEGPVTLLGDAAHAMTPNMGQGASQALEDAVTLGRCAEGAVAVAPALRDYERARRARAAGFVHASWWAGRVAQWEGGLACAARDAAMRVVPRALMRELTVRAAAMTRVGPR